MKSNSFVLCFRVYSECTVIVLLQLYFLTLSFMLDERLLVMFKDSMHPDVERSVCSSIIQGNGLIEHEQC